MEEVKIRISVLVPVYNVEKDLPRCLDSLLGQTLRDIEVICVNDASPDGSARILEEYAARDSRLRIITKTANEERLVLRPRRSAKGPDGRNYLKAILHGATCSLCGSIYRRSLFTANTYHTLLNQSFSEDRILLTQLLVLTAPKVEVIASPTYYYCLNTASITRRKLSEKALREQLKALFWCYDYVNAEVPDLGPDNRNFIVRYMSLYLEKGVPRSVIESSYPQAYDMLQFAEISKATSPRFAFHTVMCKHSMPYRSACTRARGLIRKIQGKD